MKFLPVSIVLVAVAAAHPWKRQNATESTAGNKIIPVVVGGQQDVFIPNRVTAAPGDIIQFQFNSGNHTVTQSAEDQACVPLQQTVAGAVHSGHIPFTTGQETVGTFNMVVKNTDTMFLYCATGPHCQEGQVMVVNPTSEQQIIEYANRAAAATENIDGTEVAGGIVGEIPVASAIFVPVAEEDIAPPAAPPAEGETPPAEGEAPPAETTATTSREPAATVGAVLVTGGVRRRKWYE